MLSIARLGGGGRSGGGGRLGGARGFGLLGLLGLLGFARCHRDDIMRLDNW